MAIERIPFELNFGQYPWKGNLMVQTDFLVKLQKSWKEAIKSMEAAKETIKKQFDKKKQNPQGLKAGDNVQLEAKNIHSNRPSKKLDQKKYGSFRILKDIR